MLWSISDGTWKMIRLMGTTKKIRSSPSINTEGLYPLLIGSLLQQAAEDLSPSQTTSTAGALDLGFMLCEVFPS